MSQRNERPSAFKTLGCALSIGAAVCGGIALLLVIGLVSCMRRLMPDDETPILAHLEERYGEPFVIADHESDADESGGTDTMFYFTTTAYCHPAADPACLFHTWLKHNKDAPDTIRDDYAAVRVSRVLAEDLEAALAARFGDIEVLTTCSAQMDDPASAAFDPAGYLERRGTEAAPFMVRYYLDIDLDEYTETGYAAEFDDVSAALAAVCEASHTNGTILLHFGTPKWCAASAEWHTTHTPDRALPGGTGEGSIYHEVIDYEAFCYDCETDTFTLYYAADGNTNVRETYIAGRSRKDDR